MTVETAEVTIQEIKWPDKKIPFARVKTAEQGWISLDEVRDVQEFKVGDVCVITYLLTEKGYKNNGKRVGAGTVASAPAPKKVPPRPPTNPADSDRMATMGMVNAMLNGICTSAAVSDVLSLGPDTVAQIINMAHDGLMRSVIKGRQVQTAHDLNDEIPFP